MSKQKIFTSLAPAAIGPYSQAIENKGILFCSGQIPLTAEVELIASTITEQTHQVLENLQHVLQAGKHSLGDVVKTTIYLKNLDDFGLVNEIYGNYFQEPYPARATIQVSKLPRDALIEIDAIAMR